MCKKTRSGKLSRLTNRIYCHNFLLLRPNVKSRCLRLHLDGSIQVGFSDTQHNLPGDGDTVEQIVDESHVVYEGVNVNGAQHQQSGDQLNGVTQSYQDRRITDKMLIMPLAGTHSEQQGRDWSAARDVDHGQKARKMAFPGTGKEEPEKAKTVAL